MFELGKLSSGLIRDGRRDTSSLRSGRAAQLAGRSPGTTSSRRSGRTRAEFFDACGRYQVSIFNYDPEEAADELRRDVETLRNLPDTE